MPYTNAITVRVQHPLASKLAASPQPCYDQLRLTDRFSPAQTTSGYASEDTMHEL
jgi:hypothetical protein